MAKLSRTMTIAAFDNGYWYATELKEFAEALGIPSAQKLRKDELERAIRRFLQTGEVALPTKRSLAKRGPRDVDVGLRLDLPITSYTSNKETKEFLVREAKKLAPDLERKSGARYRLNRWREEQLTSGRKITYRDLVEKYVELNSFEGAFAQIPHGRYINFLADFMRAEKGASREDALRAWHALKKIEAPKTYSAWVASRKRT